jgi:integral membrane protein
MDAIAAGSDKIKALNGLRLVALMEGVSYALLLCVAMPLKHVWHLPLATKLAGSVHGFLTLWFILALVRAALELKWPLKRSALAFMASLVPFGAFVFDHSLVRERRTLS